MQIEFLLVGDWIEHECCARELLIAMSIFCYFVCFLVDGSRDECGACLRNVFIADSLHKAVSCKLVVSLIGRKQPSAKLELGVLFDVLRNVQSCQRNVADCLGSIW